MTQRHLDGLRRLLPEWEFENTSNGLRFWDEDGNPLEEHLDHDTDYLCGEIERAMLRQDDVELLIVFIGKDGYCIEAQAIKSATWYFFETPSRSTKLEALCEAVCKYWEGKE